MCIATAALITAIAGTGLAVTSSIAQGNAAKANGNYQAQVARNNAVIEEQNAQYAEKSGNESATVAGMRGARSLAGIKTKQAANGLDINSGSAVNVRAGEAEGTALDVATTRHNAALQAYGYRTGAVSDQAQATLDQAQGRNAKIAGFLNAGSSLLEGASSVGLKWGSMQTGSLPGGPGYNYDDVNSPDYVDVGTGRGQGWAAGG